ncbi:hypothetical protein DXT76_20310 [Halobacillus trueperi]|uniref:UvrD-like helicase ATP-binding domain-containing protein n=1 Tax=Halobacillus trueperi TaxID=156205 RepID=A0A3D8VBY5_9BACI|nr:UvrD-helicase domain-containing protein [Halobacillus trueperi]RDY66937.1 hypothetical protein DXT76_20310 [Halobacillus trueperi]
MINKRVQEWEPTNGLSLEKNAIESITSNRSLLVLAGPGAGKTELLAQKVGYLFHENSTLRTPKKILAISFKRDAAKNLSERVEKRFGAEASKSFVSKTFDSFAKGLLDSFSLGIPENYRPDKNYKIAIQNKKQNDIRAAFDLTGAVKKKGLTDSQYNKKLNDVLIKNKLPLDVGKSTHTKIIGAWSYLLRGKGSLEPSLNFQMIWIGYT